MMGGRERSGSSIAAPSACPFFAQGALRGPPGGPSGSSQLVHIIVPSRGRRGGRPRHALLLPWGLLLVVPSRTHWGACEVYVHPK